MTEGLFQGSRLLSEGAQAGVTVTVASAGRPLGRWLGTTTRAGSKDGLDDGDFCFGSDALVAALDGFLGLLPPFTNGSLQFPHAPIQSLFVFFTSLVLFLLLDDWTELR